MSHEFSMPLRYVFCTVLATLLVACESPTSTYTSKPKLKSTPPSPPAEVKARDPGVRLGDFGTGSSLPGLDSHFVKLFSAGLAEFTKPNKVKDDGFGPTFNLDSCVACHQYPNAGGSSPGPTKDNPKPINPQYTFWKENLSKTNRIPSFIVGSDPANPGFTPIRIARFIHFENDGNTPDGGVHPLFTIIGLPGAEDCTGLKQPDFERAVQENNLIKRIPTPVFGAGLIEQIPDTTIIENQKHRSEEKEAYGINGRFNITMASRTNTGLPNRNGNDGTIARFGWKAQNKSLLVFAGEAYNVEMGISNELFQTERDETPTCQGQPAPNDRTHPEQSDPMEVLSDIEKFAGYMRLLAPPEPSKDIPGGSASIEQGKHAFQEVGCAFCHTPQLMTGKSDIAPLDRKQVNLYSDLLLHNMGPKLADGISQGQAQPDEFRTAPLWGLGQRMWFLHDGRTANLMQAIEEHASNEDENYKKSEANKSVQEFHGLPDERKQDLLNFLRSL